MIDDRLRVFVRNAMIAQRLGEDGRQLVKMLLGDLQVAVQLFDLRIRVRSRSAHQRRNEFRLMIDDLGEFHVIEKWTNIVVVHQSLIEVEHYFADDRKTAIFFEHCLLNGHRLPFHISVWIFCDKD